jgi:hypothetical protein
VIKAKTDGLSQLILQIGESIYKNAQNNENTSEKSGADAEGASENAEEAGANDQGDANDGEQRN